MHAFSPEKIEHGFQFLHKEDVADIHSTAYLFKHVKSGARLLYLQNDDDNKVFSISFRTPPTDNTGVFHILEHSVLCGSDKYPVKEPFVEMLKGSLSTFLNAFTFSDKTMYPVASRNDKDFQNLIDVYLDAVFHPNIYKYKEILEQEGWHYELNDPNEPITYKGVVYNEMKGVFSSPEGLLVRSNQNSLFPDTAYRFESGGDPLEIPELTYEQFIKTHKAYYSPANSYIYLYGDLDIEQKLAYLDQNYLRADQTIDVDSAIAVQKPIGSQNEYVREYPVLPNSDLKNKTYLSLNFAVGSAADAETYIAFDILNDVLLDSPAAPLKHAILDAGIGQDVFGMYDNSIRQPFFSVNVKNADVDQKDAFKKVVFETLGRLAKEGIDQKLIEAAVNIKEFQLREADYGQMPKGLVYSIMAMDSWLYDEDPLIHLRFEHTLAKIRQSMHNGYFEDLVKKYLIASRHQSLVVVKPSTRLAENESKKIAERLAEFKQNLKPEALDALVESTKKLKTRQTNPDRPEDLDKLPVLSLRDIDRKAEELPVRRTSFGGTDTLIHEIETSKIAYINLYFDTMDVPEDEIVYLGLLETMLGRINTDRFPYKELVNEINIRTGGIDFTNQVFAGKNNDMPLKTAFTLKAKILADKLPEAFELIQEIVLDSRFDDQSRLREIIREVKSRLEMSFNQNGQSVAMKRLASYMSVSGRRNEQLSGLSFYQFVCELEAQFESRIGAVQKKLAALAQRLFTTGHLIASVTGDKTLARAVGEQIERLAIPESSSSHQTAADRKRTPDPLNEGLMTSSKVQFVVKGANFRTLGYSFSGKMLVLKQILTLNYLWNRVRVQGGAYGCGVSLDRSGSFIYWSYRDPNLGETLNVYDEAGQFARQFDPDDREMAKYIVGTMARVDAPLTPRSIGERADARYFRQLTLSDIQKMRDEILATHKADIHAFADLLDKVAGENFICVFGNEEKIQADRKLFKRCLHVFH